MFRRYLQRFGRNPNIEIFHEYFFLFSCGDVDSLPAPIRKKFLDNGNEDETIKTSSRLIDSGK